MGRRTVAIQEENATGKIVERLPSQAIRSVITACSYRLPNIFFMKRHLREAGRNNAANHVKEWKSLFHAATRRFPIGLMARVVDTLQTIGYDVEVLGQDTGTAMYGKYGYEYPAVEGYQMRQYQEEAVSQMLAHRRGIIHVATGGGKTVIAGHAIQLHSLTTLFLVHTKDLLYQAKTEFTNMFGDKHVGQIGDGVHEPAAITVATIQTMSRALGVKYVKNSFDDADIWEDLWDAPLDAVRYVIENTGLIFMDECHRVASDTALNFMMAVDAPKRFGLSASPWRDDNADMVIEGVLGEKIFQRNASELYRSGYLVAPIIRMLSVPSVFAGRKPNFNSIYKSGIVENEMRNRLGLKHAVRMIKNGMPTMILIRQIRHGEMLQHMMREIHGIKVPFLSGRDNSMDRKQALDDMRSGKLQCIIASTIADEGLDIKPLAGLVLLGGGKSSVKALQRVGRALRPFPGKEYAEVIDFEDNSKWLLDHSVRRKRLYESEDAWHVLDC